MLNWTGRKVWAWRRRKESNSLWQKQWRSRIADVSVITPSRLWAGIATYDLNFFKDVSFTAIQTPGGLLVAILIVELLWKCFIKSCVRLTHLDRNIAGKYTWTMDRNNSNVFILLLFLSKEDLFLLDSCDGYTTKLISCTGFGKSWLND